MASPPARLEAAPGPGQAIPKATQSMAGARNPGTQSSLRPAKQSPTKGHGPPGWLHGLLGAAGGGARLAVQGRDAGGPCPSLLVAGESVARHKGRDMPRLDWPETSPRKRLGMRAWHTHAGAHLKGVHPLHECRAGPDNYLGEMCVHCSTRELCPCSSMPVGLPGCEGPPFFSESPTPTRPGRSAQESTPSRPQSLGTRCSQELSQSNPARS